VSCKTAPFSATTESNRVGARTRDRRSQDSTAEKDGQYTGTSGLLHRRTDVLIDRVVHGDRAIEVEREYAWLHVGSRVETTNAIALGDPTDALHQCCGPEVGLFLAGGSPHAVERPRHDLLQA